ELVILKGSRFLNGALRELGLPKGLMIGAVSREDRVFIPGPNDSFEVDDHVMLIGGHDVVEETFYRFEHSTPTKKGVVIAGGGETGYHLAKLLAKGHYSVVLMEADLDKCNDLAARLPHATVVHSDARIKKNLQEERVGSADVFVACTGDDENNIMACVETKELGVKNVLAIVSRPDYANVLGKLGLSGAVSPRQVFAKQIMSYLTTGPMIFRKEIVHDDDREENGVTVIETKVVEDAPATEHVLALLELPPACRIASLTRNDVSRVPGADDRLQPGDVVVLLAANSSVDDALKLFYPHGRPG
ncbi:MAG: NAD-binding protein, partial [Planctomycetales bacterium]